MIKQLKDKSFFTDRNLDIPKNQKLRKQEIAKIYLEEKNNET